MIDFDSIISAVKNAASAAGQKTGELYELSKLKVRILSLKTQLNKEYKKLGRAVYLQSVGEERYEIYIQGRIDVISAIMDEIDRINEIINGSMEKETAENRDAEEEIRSIRAEIAQIKGEISSMNE